MAEFWNNFEPLISVFVFILAAIFAVFLFFRGARHELVDDDILFDSLFIGVVGGLFGGRLLDFVLRPDYYNFSFFKLFFFNVYPGFDWYGAVLGALIILSVFLQKKKESIWFILDLASPPIVFAGLIISVFNTLYAKNLLAVFYSVGLLVIFWVLKRLGKIKRNNGYFFSLTLILVSILSLSLSSLSGFSYKVYGYIEYEILVPAIFLFAGLINFHRLSKQKLKVNLKILIGLLTLGIFKVKRVMTSTAEANTVSKSILLSPLSVSKFVVDLVKLLIKEIQLSIIELIQVLGIKK